ncbi:Inorganic pyrophosphatase [uncultured archaeon]|nr:Inorganic pyrophosphatase [uncultured archaeon]
MWVEARKVMITVETPKWSFIKYRATPKGFVKELTSPLPTIFNYGFVWGELGGDGMPADAVILGGRLPQGTTREGRVVAEVLFKDAGCLDNKLVVAQSVGLSFCDKMSIRLFFRCYALFKNVRSRLRRSPARAAYVGLLW